MAYTQAMPVARALSAYHRSPRAPLAEEMPAKAITFFRKRTCAFARHRAARGERDIQVKDTRRLRLLVERSIQPHRPPGGVFASGTGGTSWQHLRLSSPRKAVVRSDGKPTGHVRA